MVKQILTINSALFMKKVILIIAILSLSLYGISQTIAQQRCENIGNGINLSNWLEAYWLVNIPGQPYPVPDWFEKSDLVFMKEMGFTTVRLPVAFERITDSVPPYHLQTEKLQFALVDSVITWASELELLLIIDNHHGYVLEDATYEDDIPRLTAMWKQIVQRYEHVPADELYFELKNEPESSISQANLQVVFDAIIDTIRNVNQTHTIIAGSNYWNSGYSLIASQPYSDDNIIYTFHYYEPFGFTHQGFVWAGYPGTGILFPSNQSEITAMHSLFSDVHQWAETHNVPVFLGEFGPGLHADTVSRCNWISEIGFLCDSLNFPYTYWDWEHDFTMFKSRIMCQDSIYTCFEDALGLEFNGVITSYIYDIEEDYAVSLFPNPAQNYIEINLPVDVDKIEIYSNSGQIMKQTCDKYINVQTLVNGIYHVIVYAQHKVYNLSFIKK
jgi:endoglucanase